MHHPMGQHIDFPGIQQRGTSIMKRMLYLACFAASLCFVGACAKSVERAQRDVQRAHDQAVRDVENKQADLRHEQRDSNERVARQERRVEDAARRGTDNIIKQERELEDAQRAEGRREANDNTNHTTTPAINDRSGIETNRSHVDVNVNRGPGGVSVDVNRTP